MNVILTCYYFSEVLEIINMFDEIDIVGHDEKYVSILNIGTEQNYFNSSV
jgi:hypothetical protein